MIGQRAHEVFRLGGSKLFIEINDQQMGHAEIADEDDLVLGRGQQMRGALRPQDLFRVWIERDYDRCSIRGARVRGGSGNYGLVSEVNTVENADREKNRAAQFLEFGNGMKNLHQENDE